jgi:hypothetical protein
VCGSSCFESCVGWVGFAGVGVFCWSGLLVGGPPAAELLLRRSPFLLRRSARYERVEACLLHAERTARVTLCSPGTVFVECAGTVLTCDGRVNTAKVAVGVGLPGLGAFDAIARVCAPCALHSAGLTYCMTLCLSGWGAKAFRRNALGEGATCRLMVGAAAT